jgi:hypothetical protein
VHSAAHSWPPTERACCWTADAELFKDGQPAVAASAGTTLQNSPRAACTRFSFRFTIDGRLHCTAWGRTACWLAGHASRLLQLHRRPSLDQAPSCPSQPLMALDGLTTAESGSRVDGGGGGGGWRLLWRV